MDTDLIAVSEDGTRIAYEHAGAGRPVLLIHGFASSREQNWRSTGWIDRLTREGFSAVAFDCRGHGYSDKPHSPDRYGPHMIEDIVAVMDGAGLPDADMVGYSMGAMLAISFLMLHPARVGRVVVAGLGENYFTEDQAWRDKIADAMLVDDPAVIEDEEVRRFRIFGGQKGKDRFALSACMRAPRQKYRPEELQQAKHPVLVAVGSADTLVGAPHSLAGAFAQGRAVILSGKDHMSAVGDPALKRAVLAFLNGTD